MPKIKPCHFINVLLLSAVYFGSLTAQAKTAQYGPEQLQEEEAYAIGIQAYIYSYSLVEVSRTLYQFTHLLDKQQPIFTGGANKLWVAPGLITPEFRTVVSPNNDTLYATAMLDLSNEPVLLHTLDLGDRYFTYQFLDVFMNSFAYVGTRATHGKRGTYALVGPGWQGKLPRGVTPIASPTPHVWLIGRILVESVDEVASIREIFQRSTLAPLSTFERGNMNSLAAPRQVPLAKPLALQGLQYFEFANRMLNINQPDHSEAALMALFSRIGFGPGQHFDRAKLSAPVRRGLMRAIPVAKAMIAQHSRQMGTSINGWDIALNDWGTYGHNYLQRAAVALEQLGTNITAEAVYASARFDSQDQLLNGENHYVLRFEKGQMPPVNAFWSMTLYDVPNYLLVDNPINRYAIGDRTKGLVYGQDGSLEIYIQHASPGPDRASNWLPAPAGPFYLLLRQYLPGEEITSGQYRLPAVKRSTGTSGE